MSAHLGRTDAETQRYAGASAIVIPTVDELDAVFELSRRDDGSRRFASDHGGERGPLQPALTDTGSRPPPIETRLLIFDLICVDIRPTLDCPHDGVGLTTTRSQLNSPGSTPYPPIGCVGRDNSAGAPDAQKNQPWNLIHNSAL